MGDLKSMEDGSFVCAAGLLISLPVSREDNAVLPADLVCDPEAFCCDRMVSFCISILSYQAQKFLYFVDHIRNWGLVVNDRLILPAELEGDIFRTAHILPEYGPLLALDLAGHGRI